MHIIVASGNPVKVEAVRLGFAAMFENESFTIEGLKEAKSGVADNPRSDAETLQGAVNRVGSAKQLAPEADFWAGLEGGTEEREGGLQAFAWVVVADKQQMSKSRSVSFPLPSVMADYIRQGHELGYAVDQLLHRTNVKQQEGAIGVLTNKRITRMEQYKPAVMLALLPFVQPEYFPVRQ